MPGRQEVSGSTPLFSTLTSSDNTGEVFLCKSAVTLPNSPLSTLNRSSVELRIKPYTTPILKKGKPITFVPKGSNKLTEQAKQNWFIEFSYHNSVNNKNVRIRVTNNLNRVKDAIEKTTQFEQLLEAYKLLLENGYNPFDKQSEDRAKNKLIPLTLSEAKLKFITYHKAKGTRSKSIMSYLSKINQLISFLGAEKNVTNITEFDVNDYLQTYEQRAKWTGVTYNLAKTALNNFFKYLLLNKYIQQNPTSLLERRREVKTELHQVFTDEDFVLIMNWLRKYDFYCLLFIQTIYYTCIRPKELRFTLLKFIDLTNDKITIPAHISKNKKAIPVKIDPALKKELVKLNLDKYPQDHFLFGDVINIVGKNKIGENTPYNRFQKCLAQLGLTGKNYTLYSFKHLSNVRKYLAGWTIAEICSANRHSSLVETETYLKDLIKFIPQVKEVPLI